GFVCRQQGIVLSKKVELSVD
ncbi:MAG: PTS glucitol/sorbitol transporter subunit IIC, partial [Enterococcus faecium]